MSNLALRLKYFRKRTQLSQMELELEINAAFGSISRIEAGKVNPTKETILRISKVLKLTDRELDYLIGPTSIPATLDEIHEAQNEIKDYFNTKGVIAYLVDDRYRLIAFSRSFIKLFNKHNDINYQKEIILKTLPELLLEPKYQLSSLFGSSVDNLKLLLTRFNNEMGFMKDDPYYLKIIKEIKNNDKAKKIWKDINSQSNVSLFSNPQRKISFKVMGKNFKMNYSNEHLQRFKRYDVVEYIPNNWFFKEFKKFI